MNSAGKTYPFSHMYPYSRSVRSQGFVLIGSCKILVDSYSHRQVLGGFLGCLRVVFLSKFADFCFILSVVQLWKFPCKPRSNNERLI